MKPPKFLIAHNEAAQPGAAFIVHTQDPSFVGKIIMFEDEKSMSEFVEANECIIVNEKVIIHIEQYLESKNFSRIEGLKKSLKKWMTNYLGRK